MSVSSMTVGGKTKYKIVILGDQCVGKTAIIDRFINDRFQETYNATIGIDFLIRNLTFNNKTYRLQLWDTAGQERFKSLIPSYLKDSNCAVIVYDLTSLKSLQNTSKWLELYKQHKDLSACVVLVGNKSDVEPSVVTQELIQAKSKELGIKNYRLSAKTGEGVNNMFMKLIQQMGQRIGSYKMVGLIQEKQTQQQDFTNKVAISTTNHLNLSKIVLEEIKQDKKQKRLCC